MANIDAIAITTLAERPHLADELYDFDDGWPMFMRQDMLSQTLLGRVPEMFPAYCVVATAGARVVARGLSAPFDAKSHGTDTPDQGWDRVLAWAFRDLAKGSPRTAASALEIAIDTGLRGRGLSYRVLAALRDAVARQGHDALLAPVRPNEKHRQPRIAMSGYIRERREDGLPLDAWLRAHVRAGGVIEKVAPASMTIVGSLAQWRAWTGLPFDRHGDVTVPGALTPVHCDPVHDQAVYIEPNVWVRHRIG